MKAHAFIAALLGACVPIPQPPPVPNGDACALMCDHATELGCDFAGSTPHGATCTDVCRVTEATGWSTMHPACMLRGSTCAAMQAYSVTGCEE